MIKYEDVMKTVNETTLNNPILQTRINSVQLEILGKCLVDSFNQELQRICNLNNLIYQ